MNFFSRKKKRIVSIGDKATKIYKDFVKYKLTPDAPDVPDVWKDRRLQAKFLLAYMIQEVFFEHRKYGEPVHMDFITNEMEQIAPFTIESVIREEDGIVLDGKIVTVISKDINAKWCTEIFQKEIDTFPNDYFYND